MKRNIQLRLCINLCLIFGLWSIVQAELGQEGGRADAGTYINAFAVRLKGEHGRDAAESIAAEHGFKLRNVLPHSNVYIFAHPEIQRRSKRSSGGHVESLLSDPRVAHAQQEVLLHRSKRRVIYDKQLELPIRNIEDSSVYKRVQPASISRRDNLDSNDIDDDVANKKGPKFIDPYFKDMWYLVNNGQSGGEIGLDLNVGIVWQSNITGKGVVVCILDDGIDHTHPDLKDNYDPEASTDLNDQYDFTDDPMPDTSNSDNSHGTRCAGEVAASANNHVCGVGVAYNAKIGAVRVLDGPVHDALEAEAISFNRQYVDVYSASWGPSDDGTTMEGPRELALGALQDGVRKGRNGLGSIFVWATGNGGMYDDDCSADGYVSRPETLSVGSVNDWGRSPFFMENCTSTLAVVPSGGEDYRGQEEDNGEVKLKVVTTDMSGGCIENFQGTSSAAPLAAGCVANVLQANPNLSWRDVQHIVVRGTRVPSVDSSWTVNGAGHHVSHKFGFGLMDCGRMVALAQDWIPVPEHRVCNMTRRSYRGLPYRGRVSQTIMADGCLSSDDETAGPIDRLEHVQVYVKMTTLFRGDISLALVSPAGTRSVLLSQRPLDDHVGHWEFAFMTVHSWDESPRGKWTLEIHHKPHVDSSSGETSKIPKDKLATLKQKIHELADHLDEDDSSESNDEEKPLIGYLKEWSLTLYGTHGTRHGRTGLSRDRKQAAYQPTRYDVAKIKSREVKMAREVNVKRAMSLGSDAIERKNTDSKIDGETWDDLATELWEILHSHGAKDIRKRILQSRKRNFKDPDAYGENYNQENWEAEFKEVAKLTEKVLDNYTRKRNI